MATDYCKYHPLTTATWHCAGCHISVCDDCTHTTGDAETVPQCLLCNQALLSLTHQQVAEPYWLHYTDFMRMPFNPIGAVLLLVMMLLPVFAPEGMLLPIGVLSYVVLGLYGWGLLQHTTSGSLVFPTVSNITKSISTLALQVSIATAVVFIGLGFLGAKLGGAIWIIGILLMLFAPLLLMAVVVDKSISSLWQFQSWKSILAGLGLYYWPLAGMVFVVFTAAYAIIHLLADVLPVAMVQGLEHGFYGYALWGMMTLCGYALFQFHKTLHFEIVGERKSKKRIVSRKLDNQSTRLEVYLKEGLYDRAMALLKVLSEKEKKNPEIQERYYNFLVFMHDKEQIPYQATNYLEALIETNQAARALEVLVKLQFLIPEFRPQTAEMCFDLAKACSELNDYQRAVSLLRNLHKEFPLYPNLADAYFMLAMMLNEKLQDKNEALEVLDFVMARFKKHARFELMRSYWLQLGGKPKTDFMM